MIDTLYIIGNGFDLHHGVESNYGHFHEWLKTNYAWDYDEIESFFGAIDLWSELEQNMALFNYEKFGTNTAKFSTPMVVQNTDGSVHGFSKAVTDVYRRMYEWREKMGLGLSDWVKTLSVSNTNEFDIKKENAVFLTFNYTRTLEDLYGIIGDRILHIHGQLGDERGSLVLGHGGNVATPTYSPDVVEIEDAWGEEEKAAESARQVVLLWRKPVSELINQYHDFWERLNDVANVYTLGFSFSEVDLPYIKKVAMHVLLMTAKWHIGWHKDGEAEKFRKAASASGVDINNIAMFRI